MSPSSILAANTQQAGGFDPTMILLFVIFAVVIFMMFRKQKKAKAAQAEQQAQLAPGVSVMTNFGLFGTVLSVDAEENKVLLELSPGNTATVHRQTIAKITAPEQDTVVPDDASTLATGSTAANRNEPESVEETLARLDKENSKDN